MERFIGLDVSLKASAILIRQGGSCIWRGKCASDPALMADRVRRRAPQVKRVVFETGPLSTWFFHALPSEGPPVICIEARHAQKILNQTLNQTEANDADGLAHLAEAGFDKAVRLKGFEAMLTRILIGVRKQVSGMSILRSNQIRGVMKTFGPVAPQGKGRVFQGHVREFLAGNDSLAKIILPLLNAWRDIRKRGADLDRQLLTAARNSKAAQLSMTIPGIDAITPLSFSAADENPGHFKRSRSVGAWLGLTTRRYQSGKVDYDGRISRRGDSPLHSLPYEAAVVMLRRIRSRHESRLKDWGLKLRERIGIGRAAVAVARKLTVMMHGMLKTGVAYMRLLNQSTHSRGACSTASKLRQGPR